MPPFAAALGELSVFEDVGSATLLRLVAPPGVYCRPIGSSLGWMRFEFLQLCPSAFGSLWAGNQVTGVRGLRGTGVAGGGGVRWGAITCRMGWLTTAPGALPPDPRQGLLAPGPPPRGDGPPLEPPSSLARSWSNDLKRCGGGSRCAGSGRCGDAVGHRNSPDGVADSAPGEPRPWSPPRGRPPWNRHPRWRVGGATALGGGGSGRRCGVGARGECG